MAKKEKKAPEEAGQPAWLVTFTDLMTLMLTFFVLLVSMAVIDERRKLIVLGSIFGTFGIGKSYDLLSTKDTQRKVEPGPMEMESADDLEPLKDLIWEDMEQDLNFASNRFVQVFSINNDVLFEPGEVELKPEGRRLLERVMPVLLQIGHPLLLAGHTSGLRDEMGTAYRVEALEEVLDASWKLSFFRVMSVYRFLLDSGMDPEMLRVEAYGRFRPRHPDLTARDRRRNRRVDIILDKRNVQWMEKLGPKRAVPQDREFKYKDFIFELGGPEGQETRAEE